MTLVSIFWVIWGKVTRKAPDFGGYTKYELRVSINVDSACAWVHQMELFVNF